MSIEQPPVSIIMPCYNSADTLSAALDSLLALDYPVYEVIVVDDCSTDDSLDIARAYAADHGVVRLFRLDVNSGVQAARDFGARKARYEWIASTDSDAVLPADWLMKGARNFEGSDLVGGPFISTPISWIEKSLDCLSLNRQQSFRRFHRDNTVFDPYAGGANMFYRKAVFEAVGGYSQRFRAGEDLFLVAKAIEGGYRYTFDPEVFVFHPYSPKCGNLREFICRNWQSHKWRKVMGKESRLIRNRNMVIALCTVGIVMTVVAVGVLLGRSGILFFSGLLLCTLLLQACSSMKGSGPSFLHCFAGAFLKLARRMLGGFAIVIPGGPTQTGWSKRS